MNLIDIPTIPLGYDLGSKIGGAVDHLDPRTGISGWFCDVTRIDGIEEIHLFAHGQLVGSGITFRDRPDIDNVVGGTSRAGFLIPFSRIDKNGLTQNLSISGDCDLRLVVAPINLELQWVIPHLTLQQLYAYIADHSATAPNERETFYLDALDVWNSGAFDPQWYSSNAGLSKGSDSSALHHFLTVGDPTGLKPSFYFDTRFFARVSGRKSLRGSLLHYARATDPSLSTSIHFDAGWFCTTVPATPGKTPLGTYLMRRHEVGPNRSFDPARYLAENPDLVDISDPYEHFVTSGIQQGRSGSPIFDEWRGGRAATRSLFEKFLRSTNSSDQPAHTDADAEEDAGAERSTGPSYTDHHKLSVDQSGYSSPSAETSDHNARIKASPKLDDVLSTQISTLLDLGLLDIEYYITRNNLSYGDIADPESHYLSTGESRGFKPNPYFDPVWYCKKHFDFAPPGGALKHYIEHGESLGHRPHPCFDPIWYASDQAIERGGGKVLAHYLAHRRHNIASPNPYFSVAAYLDRYPDIKAANIDAFEHWYNAGLFEGRVGSVDFDQSYVWRTYLNDDRTKNPFLLFMDLGLELGWHSVEPPSHDQTKKAMLNPAKLDTPTFRALLQAEDTVKLIDGTSQPDELLLNVALLLKLVQKNFDRAKSLNELKATNLEKLSRTIEEIGGIGGTVGHFMGILRRSFPSLEFENSVYPDVSIVVPVHNKFQLTYDCLNSIHKAVTKFKYEVIIVDDLSSDETLLSSLVFLGGARVIRAERNQGFVGSCNLGASYARGRFVLFLNNDTLVDDNWLDPLVETLDRDQSIGIVGSRLLFSDGVLQEAGGIIWADASGWNWGRGQDKSDPRFSFMRDVDYVSGAALMIRKELWQELGGFDVRYAPAYYEDTDLCFRTREAGRRVVMQPASTIIHLEGQSNGTSTASGLKRYQVINHKKFQRRWAKVLARHSPNGHDPNREAERQVHKKALFIDDTTPTPDQDAGSNAALEHMLSLQRLGYKVIFLPADNMAFIPKYTTDLQSLGVECWYAPFAWSVEEYLRKNSRDIDLVYIHRKSNAVRYLHVVRKFLPEARVLFNYADIHALRELREAELLGLDKAHRQRLENDLAEEVGLANQVDSVIVHSTFEAAFLRDRRVQTRVNYVPWRVEPKRTPVSYLNREGIVFIGGFGHTPNIDAVDWFVAEIWPKVLEKQGRHAFKIVGSKMPERFREFDVPAVEGIGFVADLDAYLDRTLLTVAPLRYGAGLKGKVLTSFARGVPCVMTSIASEGMDLPFELQELVADDPQSFARTVSLVASSQERWMSASTAGLRFIRDNFSAAAIDNMLKAAIR